MASMSLCMIVKNEEETLLRCLNSIKAAVDEIIIVDTGSTDNTKSIALDFGVKLFDFEWINDFSVARNYAFSKATKDYIIWLDADDILKANDLDKLITLKKDLDGSVRQIAALYNVAFDECNNVTMSYYRERIFKNDHTFVWSGAVHECIPFIIDVKYSDIAITHSKIKPSASGRNLEIYKILLKQRPLIPRELYYYARELYYNNFHSQAKTTFLQFLNTNGWYVNKIDACLLISKCWQIDENFEEAQLALLNSFIYSEPTAEICCELARLFMENCEYKLAIYWYATALNRVPDIKTGSFVNPDDFTYIPAIQLCVCYDKLGDIKTSKMYNDLASTFKPNSKSVELNKLYFAHIKDAL